MTERTAIGIDIGGSRIAGGLVTEDGRVLHRRVVPRPDSRNGTITMLDLLVEELRARDPRVAAVGIGTGGMVEWPTGRVRWAPEEALHGLPLGELVGERSGLPAIVENDANAAAVAETRFGGGSGCRNSITLTVGESIGGGIVLDGELFRGHTGLGAEVGHLLVSPRHGELCTCGNRGCLDAMASGAALRRAARELARDHPGELMATLAGGPEGITEDAVFAAALRGDPLARFVFEELGYWLGVGIASLVNVFEPQIVILAGGIAATARGLLLGPTRAAFESLLLARVDRGVPPIVLARLGQEAGVVGAAVLALESDQTVLAIPAASASTAAAVIG